MRLRELGWVSSVTPTVLVGLTVGHIDRERGLLRVDLGKGAKDRQVILPPTLLTTLRAYWRHYRLSDWLFPGRREGDTISVATAQ